MCLKKVSEVPAWLKVTPALAPIFGKPNQIEMNHARRSRTFFAQLFSIFLIVGNCPFAATQIADVQAFGSMSDAERYRFVQDLPFFSMDSAAVRQTISALLPVAESENDDRTSFVLKFKQFIEREKLRPTQEQILQNLSELESLAARGGWQIEQAVAHHYLFFQNFVNKKISFEQTYLEVGQAFERMEKLGFEQFRDYQPDALLYHLGKFIWDLDDREKAVQFFTVAERFAQPTEAGSYHLTAILNHLQSYFQQKKDYPRAIEYAQKIIDFRQNLRYADARHQWLNHFWEGLALLDIANMLVEQGKLAESETFALRGYELAKISQDPNQSFQSQNAEFDALQVMLSIKLKTKKLAEIEPLVRRSETLKSSLENDPNGWYFQSRFVKFHQNLARFHEMRGDFSAAMRSTREAQAVQDSLDRRNDARKFEQLKQRREAEKYASHIREIEQEKRSQRQLIFGMSVVLLLLALAAWLNFKRLQAKRAEATAATNELAALTRNFQEKSALADTLHSELDRLAARSERNEQLEALAHTVILTDDDWSRFRSLFEKVHPGFIEEQRRLHPELSAAELRLLVLEKLELGDHEIANLLGVSVKTVHQTRWRLHKKLGA